jgi:NADH dehydrogenase (ubiquinone) 1 alpha subcomplex subunit 9
MRRQVPAIISQLGALSLPEAGKASFHHTKYKPIPSPTHHTHHTVLLHLPFLPPANSYKNTESIACKSYSTHLAIRGVDAVTGGPGGRSSINGLTATIFGGTGFLGRYIAQALSNMGTRVVVPHRCDALDVQHLKTMGDVYAGNMVLVPDFDIRNDDHIKRAISKSNIVFNLIGADRETWNYKFDEVHVDIADRIASTVKSHGSIQRFIHLSAIGASPSAPSRRLQTKAAGEAAVKSHLPETSTIFRPAPMTGPEDRFFNNWANLAKRLPIVPIVEGGEQQVQPVWVRDVTQGIVNSLYSWDTLGKSYDLAGPDVFTMRQIVDFVFDTIRETNTAMPVPASVMKMLAKPGDYIASKSPIRPQNYMLTEDKITEAGTNFIQGKGTLGLADLDVIAHKVTEGMCVEYLRYYRSGGYDFGSIGAK